MKKNVFMILCFSIFLGAAHSGIGFCETYYLSPSGSDSHAITQAQASSTPWKTFSRAFGVMAAADKLILLDGIYSVANGTGCIGYNGDGSAVPSNGTSTSAMTTIIAQNIGKAIISGLGGTNGYPIFLGTTSEKKSHIKIEGVRLIGGVHLYNADYCYLKNIGSNGSILMGSNDHTYNCDYNLVEDCWIWAYGIRVLGSTYEGRYNVWRRVVLRGDGYSRAQYSPGITSYNSQYTLFQNVIVVDRTLSPDYKYGDFCTAQHTGTANNYKLIGNEWHGCMSVNGIDQGFHFEADSQSAPSHLIKNCLVLHDTDESIAGMNIAGVEPVVENCTIIQRNKYTVTPFTFSGSTAPTLRNMIISGDSGYDGISGSGASFYIDLFGTFDRDVYRNSSCSTGCLTSNPENDGSPTSLLYPVRVESGSALSGTGYNSKDYGATILKKHGTTGAFYGEPGYNTLTSDDLWPWPNEDLIKSQMSEEYNASATEKRGFCTGTSKDGSPQTLTKYIWEYLGNPIPSEIYGSQESLPGTVTWK